MSYLSLLSRLALLVSQNGNDWEQVRLCVRRCGICTNCIVRDSGDLDVEELCGGLTNKLYKASVRGDSPTQKYDQVVIRFFGKGKFCSRRLPSLYIYH